MNPAKFQLDDDREQQHARRDQMMNGNRPSPLKINRGSYLIQKPSSNSRMANKQEQQQQQQQYHHHHEQQQQQQPRQPVIIYTQSPKVIHTQARDFMALVQKLTGLSRTDNIHDDVDQTKQHTDTDITTGDDHVNANKSLSHGEKHHEDHQIGNNNVVNTSKSAISCCSREDNDSCSGLTDENCDNNNNNNKNILLQGSSSFAGYSPNAMFSHPNPYFADIPLFTPTSTSSTDFFCSPRPLYRFSDSSSHPSPNVGGSLSPSMFKFIKGLPEY